MGFMVWHSWNVFKHSPECFSFTRTKCTMINATENFPFITGWSITVNKNLANKLNLLMKKEYKKLETTHFVLEDIWFGYVLSHLQQNITIINDRTGYNIYGRASHNFTSLERKLYPHMHSSSIMHHAHLPLAQEYFMRHISSTFAFIRHVRQEYNRDFWIVTNPGFND